MKSIMDRHKYSPYFSRARPRGNTLRALSVVQIAATRRRSVAMTTAYSVVYLCVYPALCYTHRHRHNCTHTWTNIHTYRHNNTHTIAKIPTRSHVYIYSIHCTVPIANKLIIYEKLVYGLYIYIKSRIYIIVCIGRT